MGVHQELSLVEPQFGHPAVTKGKVWNTSKSESISSFHLAIMAHLVLEFNFLLITMLCVDWWFK